MKKSYILLFALCLTIFFISSLSAKILINDQPFEVYNIGDNVSISMNFSINELITEPIEFEMFMVCDGERINDLPIKLNYSYKYLSGKTCIAKGVFYKGGVKTEENSTNEFKISNSISLDFNLSKTSYKPNQELIISGEAVKKNGDKLDGTLEVNLGNYSDELKKSLDINNGDFSTNFTIPSDMPADRYVLYVRVYEEDSGGNIINEGSLKKIIKVEQVPTNLEIFFEKQEVIPGKKIILKPILHDQSGENIKTTAEITIKDPFIDSIKKFQIPTQKNLEFKINELTKPSNWSVSVVANNLTKNTNFEVLKNEKVELEIINNSLIVNNVGNVPYNGEVSIKIGNDTVNKNVSVDYNSSESYNLYAPEGNYSVEVSSGKEKISKNNVFLTGNAVDVEDSGKGSFSLNIFIWIFVIFVLGFVVLNIFEKGYKKGFVGRITKKKKTPSKEKRDKEQKEINKNNEQKDALIHPRNIASLSLSMKGEKQTADVICLKIKNYEELISKKDNSRISIQKIINLAEKERAYVYENNENIFFIFAPIVTKTFQNEKAAIRLSKDIKNVLENHNKTARQKIDFGIAINYGEIIAKKERERLYFMGVKNLFSGAKKMSSLSNKEILVNKDVRNRIGSDVKAEKKEMGNQDVDLYSVKEFNKVREDNKKFIDDFVKRNKDMFNK
jgi:hypothetical protein